MLAFSASDNWCHDLDFCSFRQFHDLIDHLINCLLCNLFSTFRAVRNTDAGIQQPEIVIDFCHGSDCRTRVSVCGFLVNRDSRGQSIDPLHIRFFHLSEKLSGIRRKGFHISSLSLCVDCIKCQRGFSGSGKSGQHDHFISRNIHINIFQIMLFCTPDLNKFLFFTHFFHLFILSFVTHR